MDNPATWNGQDSTMSSAPHDDFQQLLDMGMNSFNDGLNFDFPDYAGQNNAPLLPQESREAMDSRMDVDVGLLGHKDAMMQGQMPPMTTVSNHATIAVRPLEHGHSSSESLAELEAQIQYLQQQRQQHQRRQLQEQQQRNNYYAHNRMIPPTPNSIEMHSANNQFYPQSDPQHQAMYERYQLRVKEQELAFTPLVSPAVTPLEAHFNIPEYTVPGAYFSPLSSPALHAQNEHRSVYENRRSAQSATSSPNDMNVDTNPTSSGNGIVAKKATKKTTSKPRTPRAVRQSPIVKAQRRKGGGSTIISPQTLADIVEPAAQDQSQTQHATRSRASTEGSENDSISPEHLSDMAPPPIPTPGSAGRSPFLPVQNAYPRAQQAGATNTLSPATPASLMRLSKADQSSPALSNLGDADDQAMDVFSLPEPANPARPRPPRIVTQSDSQTTPTIETSTVTPSFPCLPSPAFAHPAGPTSASSPQLNSLSASSASRKTPQLSARGSKKRPSVSSVHVSPALRPKISPSIKPLIKGGSTVSEDTASLLLASKSNYQNILEGTHLPGVSYPTELSTNLTSKRTSHKIAEQGRRNRINSALQEIATLLPRGCSKDSGTEKGGSGSGDAAEGKGSGGQSANSKASTVELAIEYIKQLKQEVADANKRAEEAEKALELKVVS